MGKCVYFNGNIITMEGDRPVYAEAVLTENERIKFVGKFDSVRSEIDAETRLFNLDGRTLLPAFSDAHSHICAFAGTLPLCNLRGTKSMDEIIDKLRGYKAHSCSEFLVGFGYDDNFFTEGEISVNALNTEFPDTPVIITHLSGHLGAVNSAAAEKLSCKSGILKETEFISATSSLPQLSDYAAPMRQAEKAYVSVGITTVHEGFCRENELKMLTAFDSSEHLCDIIAYADAYGQIKPKRLSNRLKIAGYKLFTDGSPQAQTAFMTKPYIGTENRGICTRSENELEAAVNRASHEGVQLLAHCNGDAAAQMFINACKTAKKPLFRPVMIHAQTVTRSQLGEMAQLGMIASFFNSHILHYGDVHLKHLGKSRAESISPAKTALKLGTLFTFHQDTPVFAPNPLENVYCAVTRLASSGKILGESEKISTFQALKAVTVNVAFQNCEENEKGTLAVGKRADFVILDTDPITCEPEKIPQIKVSATVIRGKTVFGE